MWSLGAVLPLSRKEVREEGPLRACLWEGGNSVVGRAVDSGIGQIRI